MRNAPAWNLRVLLYHLICAFGAHRLSTHIWSLSQHIHSALLWRWCSSSGTLKAAGLAECNAMQAHSLIRLYWQIPYKVLTAAWDVLAANPLCLLWFYLKAELQPDIGVQEVEILQTLMMLLQHTDLCQTSRRKAICEPMLAMSVLANRTYCLLHRLIHSVYELSIVFFQYQHQHQSNPQFRSARCLERKKLLR